MDADANVHRYLRLRLGLGGRVLQDRRATGDREASRRKRDEDRVAFDFDFGTGGFPDSLPD